MSFKKEIAKLSNSATGVTTSNGNTILKAPVYSKGKITDYKFFAFNKKRDLVGKGGFGKVYKCFPLDPQTGMKDLKTAPWAVKVISAEKFDKEEQRLSLYYKTLTPIWGDTDEIYCLAEYFPGEDFFISDTDLNPKFSELKLGETFELFQQFCLALNLVHNKNTAKGNVVMHGDIKGNNIKINVNTSPYNKFFDVYLFDFGLSHEVEGKNILLNLKRASGTLEYTAPEVYNDYLMGIRSDVRSFTPILIALFGGDDPFEYKRDNLKMNSKVTESFFTTSYQLKGILNKFSEDLKAIPLPIEDIVKKFIERMQATTYSERPDSDELLQFSIALNNYYKLYCERNDPNRQEDCELIDELMSGYGAKLILCANGSWRASLYRTPILNNSELNVKICKEYIESQEKPILDKMKKNKIAEDKQMVMFHVNKLKSTNAFRKLEDRSECHISKGELIKQYLTNIDSAKSASDLQYVVKAGNYAMRENTAIFGLYSFFHRGVSETDDLVLELSDELDKIMKL
jgi:serine/threonine protein kinase